MQVAEVIRVSYYPPNKGYSVLLKSLDSNKELSLIVDSKEAQTISLALEGINVPRPMVNNLILDILNKFDSKLIESRITKYKYGTYYALLIIKKNNNQIIKVDARPSDAICLSLSVLAPIYISAVSYTHLTLPTVCSV